ncbi:MAG: hypothetical protein KDE14_03355 [Rhodobacteraceae bacterium]|nr:hypothetical protein [Paracoccaceae bacterium]
MSMNRRTKTFLIATGLAGTTALAAAAFAADGPRGGRGFDPDRFAERAKERCEKMADVDRKLTASQVKDIITGKLAERGESNLKVGKVTDKADGVIAVEIVTASGSLVNVRELSSKTGRPVGAEDRCKDIAERISAAVKSGDFSGRGRDRIGRHRGSGEDRSKGGVFGGRQGGPLSDRMGGRMGELGLIANIGPDRDLNLTKDQAKQLAEAGLIMLGNPRLKVGKVTEKDADTYVVDIVTADNALVLQREINRHSGRPDRDQRGPI